MRREEGLRSERESAAASSSSELKMSPALSKERRWDWGELIRPGMGVDSWIADPEGSTFFLM